MKTLNEAIASRPPESQLRVKEMAEEMSHAIDLQLALEEEKLSQATCKPDLQVPPGVKNS
jgi:hypothetical protein